MTGAFDKSSGSPSSGRPGIEMVDSPGRPDEMMIGLNSPEIKSKTTHVFGLARNNAPGFATSVRPVRCCSRTWVCP